MPDAMTGDGAAVMDRREFVRGAGALAAAGVVGASIPGSALARAGRRKRVRRVAVFGGGPAGMTAAHELAERGFKVDVYERFAVLGGKVRSLSRPGTGTGGRADLPLNMGGHYFLGGYPNIGETLGRIPIGGGRTVLDRVGSGNGGVSATLYWGESAIYLPLPPHNGLPGGLTGQRLLDTITDALRPLPLLTPQDVALIASKFAALLTSGEKRQWGQLEDVAFPDYLRADLLSPNAKVIGDFPGFLGVANRKGINTRAFERALDVIVNGAAGQTGPGLTEGLGVLDGPETEAWFEPWARYLHGLGVRFHMRRELAGVRCEHGKITGATVRDRRGRRSRVEADYYVLAVPQNKAAKLINRAMLAADPTLAGVRRLEQLEGMSLQLLLNHRVPKIGDLFTSFSTPWQTGNEILTAMWDMDLTKYGDGKAREYVSVQITDKTWHEIPGILYGKPAKDCTGTELINEVLAQFRRYLKDGDQHFAESAIHSWHVAPGVSTNLSKPLTWDEPLFPATASCWKDQPEQVTAIPNLFLAGAYTRSAIMGENMDAANESGKRAAAGIVDVAGVTAPPVTLGSFAPVPELQALREQDDINYQAGLPNTFDVVAPLFPPR